MTGTQSLRAVSGSKGIVSEETERIESRRSSIAEGKKNGSSDAWFESGMLNMLDYNFPEAKKDFAEYRRLTKNKKDDIHKLEVNSLMDGIAEGTLQFDRFQDIVVIDAYIVPRENFIKHLRLPLSAGRIVGSDELPRSGAEINSIGFISEGGDFLMWSQASENDGVEESDDEDAANVNLVEANRLVDGTLSAPKIIPNLGVDPRYPFLTADGTTLYYSTFGDNSVGGRDIFIATRDPQSGEFRQPVNAGFPFNSAADDYLLAIDEENGVGWWATDRHQLENDVVLYVFMLPDGRRNFDGPAEEKRARGRLDDIRVTWTSDPVKPKISSDDEGDEDEDEEEDETEKSPEELAELQAARDRAYEAKASEIRKIKPGQKPLRKECVIPRKGGGFIYSVDDVRTSSEKQLVKAYIDENKDFENFKSELDKKRRQYARNPQQSLGSDISGLEKRLEEKRIRLISILSELYKELGQK